MFPVSERWREKIAADMRRNGCKHPPEDVFFQGEEAMTEALEGTIAPGALQELSEGYSVTCRMDDWTVRHFYGYCDD